MSRNHSDDPEYSRANLLSEMTFLRGLNLTLRFALELFAFGALFYWGTWFSNGLISGLLLGTVMFLVAATIWGIFASPRARISLPLLGRLFVEALVFGAACLALAMSGHVRIGVSLVVLAALNRALIYALGQDVRDHQPRVT